MVAIAVHRGSQAHACRPYSLGRKPQRQLLAVHARAERMLRVDGVAFGGNPPRSERSRARGNDQRAAGALELSAERGNGTLVDARVLVEL